MTPDFRERLSGVLVALYGVALLIVLLPSIELLAAFVALALGHRAAARTVSLLSAFLGAAVLAATAFVTLDFLQLRVDVVEGARSQFDRAGWKMIAQGLLAGPTLLALAVGTWRGTRGPGAGSHVAAPPPKPGSFSAIVVEGAGTARD